VRSLLDLSLNFKDPKVELKSILKIYSTF
jgi:hypothetical protein